MYANEEERKQAIKKSQKKHRQTAKYSLMMIRYYINQYNKRIMEESKLQKI